MTLSQLFVDYVENDNQKSFNFFYKKMYIILKAYCLFYNFRSYEDIIGEVFYKLIKNKKKYNIKKDRIDNYIFIIFKNHLIDQHRRAKKITFVPCDFQ